MSEEETALAPAWGLEPKEVESVPDKDSSEQELVLHLNLDDSCSRSGNLEATEKDWGLEPKEVESVPDEASSQQELVLHSNLDDSCSRFGNLEATETAALGLEPKEVETVPDNGSSQAKPLVPSYLDHRLEREIKRINKCVRDPLLYHPYFDQCDEIVYGADALTVSKVCEPVGLEEARMVPVSTSEDLKTAVGDLEKNSEIGVALEIANNGPDYLIFSTDDVDYAVDTILLEEHVSLLVPIFIDPNITKVMVQALKFLWWLQQKHGLFVANLFDLSMGSAFVPRAVKEVRGLLSQKFHVGYTFIGRCKIQLPKEMAETDRLRAKSRFCTYLFRKTKDAILAQHGVEGYLKVKHTMDDMCKRQYYPFGKFKKDHELGLCQLVKFHDTQKKVLPQLWDWRKSCAEAHSVPAESVMTNESLMDLVVALPIYEFDISFFASSEYVDQDISEVTRIMRSAPMTIIRFPFIDDPYDFVNWPAIRRERKRRRLDEEKRLKRKRRLQNLALKPMAHPGQVCQPPCSHQIPPRNNVGSCSNCAFTSGNAKKKRKLNQPQVPPKLTRKQRKALRERHRTVELTSPIVQNNPGFFSNCPATSTSSEDKKREFDQTEFLSNLTRKQRDKWWSLQRLQNGAPRTSQAQAPPIDVWNPQYFQQVPLNNTFGSLSVNHDYSLFNHPPSSDHAPSYYSPFDYSPFTTLPSSCPSNQMAALPNQSYPQILQFPQISQFPQSATLPYTGKNEFKTGAGAKNNVERFDMDISIMDL